MENLMVLVVEDDPLIIMELEATLHDGGYATLSEHSGDGAIARLETTPNIRALLTDINLTGEISGWDVARRGRELFPTLPVVYVTSLSEGDWAAQGVPKSTLIQKPFASAQIVTAISHLLNATNAALAPQ